MTYLMRGLTFDQYEVGMRFRTAGRTITETDVVNFAGISGDYNGIHTDEHYAKTSPYETRIAHGMLGAAIASGLANRLGIFERTVIALRFQSMQYKRPIHIGDTVEMELLVVEVKGNRRGSRGTVIFETRLVNQDDKLVILGRWDLLIKGSAALDDADRRLRPLDSASPRDGAERERRTDEESGVSIFIDPTTESPEP